MSNTDWWFLDLALVVAVTGALAFGLFAGISGPFRVLLAIPFVLVLPGYALVSLLFPDETSGEYRPFDDEKTGLQSALLVEGGLESIERLILSIVMSVALVSAITLISSATPRGIVLETVLWGIALTTAVLALLAIVARYRCPRERRYVPSVTVESFFFVRRRPDPYGSTDPRPFNVAIVVGLLLLVASTGFALANPPVGDGFTEFYVETDDVSGDVDTIYETTYTVGDTGELPVTIANEEGRELSYTTVVLLQEVRYDGDDVTVDDEERLTTDTVTVSSGETETQTLEVTPTTTGEDLRLLVLLYEGEPPDQPGEDDAYRVIRLPIDVTE